MFGPRPRSGRDLSRGVRRIPPRTPAGTISAQTWGSGQEQFGDLHGVERGALAQVVVAHEQHQAAVVRDAGVLAQAAHVSRIPPGRLEGGRALAELDAWSLGEQLRSEE